MKSRRVKSAEVPTNVKEVVARFATEGALRQCGVCFRPACVKRDFRWPTVIRKATR